MEQRTCNVIACCKGSGYGDSPRESIARYMSRECGCDISAYHESTIYRIVKDAFLDYINGCGKPSNLMRNYLDSHYHSDVDRMMAALSLERVLNNEFEHVNGFTKEQLDQSKEDLK